MAVFFSQTLIFGILGGLGLFLFGMNIMSEGLQKIAGDRIRKIFSALTNNRIIGTWSAGRHCHRQSSSATTVMVVGFVSAGLMSLVQAIGWSGNIGTTVTAQLMPSDHPIRPAGHRHRASLKLFAPARVGLYRRDSPGLSIFFMASI
jgi:phosphate:Na+ symporter